MDRPDLKVSQYVVDDFYERLNSHLIKSQQKMSSSNTSIGYLVRGSILGFMYLIVMYMVHSSVDSAEED